MVRFDKEKNRVLIEYELIDVDQLTCLQAGIIELVRNYQYSNYGADVSMHIICALDLLEAIIPTYEQQKRGLEI